LDGAGRMPVQRRSLAKDSAPGLWCSSCSGHLGAGEDYGTAVVRELHEEIGLKVRCRDLRQILMVSPCPETGQEFVRVYLLQDNGPYTFDPAEISELCQFHLAELDDRMESRPEEFSPSFLHLYRFCRSCLQA